MEYLVDDVINIINECFIEHIIFDEISVYGNFYDVDSAINIDTSPSSNFNDMCTSSSHFCQHVIE